MSPFDEKTLEQIDFELRLARHVIERYRAQTITAELCIEMLLSTAREINYMLNKEATRDDAR